jgi:hypothetical protein
LRLIVSKRTVFERDLHRSCPHVVRRPRAPQAARQRRSLLSSSSHVCPVASREIGPQVDNGPCCRRLRTYAVLRRRPCGGPQELAPIRSSHGNRMSAVLCKQTSRDALGQRSDPGTRSTVPARICIDHL